MDENDAVQLESSQDELSTALGELSKSSEINIDEQQETKTADNDIDSRLSADDTGSNMAEKESEVLPIASSKSRSECKANAEKNPRSLVVLKHNCPYCTKKFHDKGMSQAHRSICEGKRFSCEFCGQKFKKLRYFTKHVSQAHPTKGELSKVPIEDSGKSVPNSSIITDCSDLSHQADVQEVVDIEPSSVNCSGQSSALTQERKTNLPEEIDSSNAFTSSDQVRLDSRLIEHSPTNTNSASNTNNATGKKFKVHPITNMKGSNETTATAENHLQPLVDNLLNRSSETKCAYCGKECSSVVALARHIDNSHVPHTCDICGLTFATFHKARYHKRMSHKEAKHKCPHCPKKFNCEKNYLPHVSNCESKKISCQLCGQKFKSSAYVYQHMRNFHKIKGAKKVPIVRKGCNKEHQAAKLTVKKEILEEEITSNPFDIIDCPICNKHFVDHIQVTRHVEAVHQMTMCTSCGMTFTSADQQNDHKPSCPQLLKHVSSQLNLEEISHGETSSSGLSDTVCPHCGKDCCYAELLAWHIAWCHQPVVCDTCGITISNKCRMKYHKIKCHSEPKFKCPHCSKECHTKLSYRRHVSIHGMDSKFSCKLCGRKYKNALAVKRHIKWMHSLKEHKTDHTDCDEQKQEPQSYDDVGSTQGEKMDLTMEIKIEEATLQEQEYQAAPDEDCGKSPDITIISASQLKVRKLACPQHLKHVDSQLSLEKVFQPHGETSSSELPDTVCPHCGKDCCNEESLAQHIAWCHKPVVCATCGVTISNKHQLRYHKIKYHSEPKFKCPHCSKKYLKKIEYLRHVSTHVVDIKFTCKLCGCKCKNALDVKDHIKRIHSLKEYQTECTNSNEQEQEPQDCDDVSFPQGKSMELKMEIKAEEPSLQEQEYRPSDEDRGKSPTFTISSASQHKVRKNPTPEPRFKCSECDKPFLVQNALRKHMAVHSKAIGEKHSLDDFKRCRTDTKEEKPTKENSPGHGSKEKRKMPSLDNCDRRRSKRIRVKE